MLTKLLIAFFLISGLLGCADSSINSFKKTDAGKALLACVSGSGDLNIEELKTDTHASAVTAHLHKSDKYIDLQFAIKPDLEQAMLIGATIKGEDNLKKLTLMMNLELVCGGEIAAKILPDEYKNMRMLNRLGGILR